MGEHASPSADAHARAQSLVASDDGWADSPVVVSLAIAHRQATGGGASDLMSGIESLHGTSGDDTLVQRIRQKIHFLSDPKGCTFNRIVHLVTHSELHALNGSVH